MHFILKRYPLANQNIELLIFDLGGVIINLHVERTISAFSKLSGKPEEEVLSAYEEAPYFKTHEKGLISDADFRDSLRNDLDFDASDDAVDEAWSAMLGTIPAKRVMQVQELSKKYTCVVLSNTNAIHEKAFHRILNQSSSYNHLNKLFHEVHFSHEWNMRKPDAEIYEKILKHHGLAGAQCLFMDDGEHNLTAAAQLGIHTLHIPRNSGFYSRLLEKTGEHD